MPLFFFRLCWKNLWRNRRRTLLTVNAIGFGVTTLLWLHNCYDAFHAQMVENAVRYQSGHLLVARANYEEEKIASNFIEDSRPMEAWLEKRKDIASFSPQILVQGMLSSPRGSATILFKGVDPERERLTTRFAANIVEGSFFSPAADKTIIIGRKLKELLRVKLGDKVVALTQGIDGSIGNELFRIGGIYDTESDWDKSLAFLTREDARGLVSLPAGAVHRISILLRREESIPNVQHAFGKAFAPAKAVMLSWGEVQKHLVAILELDKAANRILMAMILGVAALGIVNSILMGVLERTREFGVMMAVGTTREEMMGMVALETVLMALVGVAIGNVFGFAITQMFHHTGFDLAWLIREKIMVNGAVLQTRSYPVMNWGYSALVSSIILGTAISIAAIPARHIARLSAVRALRG